MRKKKEKSLCYNSKFVHRRNQVDVSRKKNISGTRLICKFNNMLDQNRYNFLVSSF